MRIVRARHAGACYGVDRALSMVREAVEEHGKPVYTLGPLIHNPTTVHELESIGVYAIDSLDEIDAGTLVIRSHGVAPQVISEALAKGLTVIDATCPHVEKAHESASKLAEDGYTVIVVGEAGHPEVEGICGYAGEDYLVVPDASALPSVLSSDHIGVVVQTTQSEHTFNEVVEQLDSHVDDLVAYDTVCFATQLRQKAAAKLANEADCMIVVGGRNSGNTRRLYDISEHFCSSTHLIESADEIEPAWLDGCSCVGVTAGASTPESQIVEVIDRLEKLS